MRRVFLFGLAAMVLASCTTAQVGAHRYTGVWEWGFETSSFRTDRGAGPYWLTAEGDDWEQLATPLREAGRGPWGQVAIVVEGELSPAGQYGHLGAYSHQLRVTRVIEARLISSSGPPPGS